MRLRFVTVTSTIALPLGAAPATSICSDDRLRTRPTAPVSDALAYKEVGPYSSRAVNAKNFIAAQLNSGSTRPVAEATSLRYAEEGTDADSPTAGSNASLASSKASSRASSRASLTGLVYSPVI